MLSEGYGTTHLGGSTMYRRKCQQGDTRDYGDCCTAKDERTSLTRLRDFFAVADERHRHAVISPTRPTDVCSGLAYLARRFCLLLHLR